MLEDEIRHDLRREADERAAGAAAPDPAARRIHLELAERYAARIRQNREAAVKLAAEVPVATDLRRGDA